MQQLIPTLQVLGCYMILIITHPVHKLMPTVQVQGCPLCQVWGGDCLHWYQEDNSYYL